MIRRDAEMVDSSVSKTDGFTSVRVRLPLSARYYLKNQIAAIVTAWGAKPKIMFGVE